MKRQRTKKSNLEVSDIIVMRGAIEYALRNAATGEIIQRGRSKNTVVTVGRAWILNRIGSNDANVIDRIKLGTSTTAPATSQTDLQNSFASKSAGTVSNAGTTANPPYYTFAASWNSNETHASSSAINEFGLFAANGTMVGRVTTGSTINFGSTNTLSVTYTLSN
jgi:hypothetical protein